MIRPDATVHGSLADSDGSDGADVEQADRDRPACMLTHPRCDTDSGPPSVAGMFRASHSAVAGSSVLRIMGIRYPASLHENQRVLT